MVGEDWSDPVAVFILLPFLSYCTPPPFELCLGRLCLAGLFLLKLGVVVVVAVVIVVVAQLLADGP